MITKKAYKLDLESFGTEYNQEFLENFKIEDIQISIQIDPADRLVGIMNDSIEDLTAIVTGSSHLSIANITQLLFEQETLNNYLNKVALPDLFEGDFDNIGIEIYTKAINKYEFLSNALRHQLESEIQVRLDDMKAEVVEQSLQEVNDTIYFKILFYI